MRDEVMDGAVRVGCRQASDKRHGWRLLCWGTILCGLISRNGGRPATDVVENTLTRSSRVKMGIKWSS